MKIYIPYLYFILLNIIPNKLISIDDLSQLAIISALTFSSVHQSPRVLVKISLDTNNNKIIIYLFNFFTSLIFERQPKKNNLKFHYNDGNNY